MNGDKSYVIATDVGGTCTDTVVFAAGEPVHIGKALSTPPDFANGVIDSIRSAAEAMDVPLGDLLRSTGLFTHGSTVVDNALLTRGGARTGLITTEGFEDTLLVTRGAYGRWAGLAEEGLKHPVKTDRAPSLVPAERIRGVPERIDYKGAVIRALDEDSAEAAIRHLVDVAGVEAIAICLLWSPYNPVHERRIREIAAQAAPGAYVTISSDIAPVPGEYERTSTTVINAYAGRLAHDYVTDLQAQLAEEGYGGPLLVMQGYGGLLPAEEASSRAVGMIECGPAAGVIGARYLGGVMGDPDVIAADMGGTTFKVGVIQGGALEFAREPLVDRYHYVAPKIEVVSIGAGGGSIVSLEPRTNVPRVGPKSAGARPGPVCYGLGGTEPTLTDVMTLIGYMDPATFLGGTVRLDIDAARAAFETRIAGPMGMDVNEAAFGIYRIAAAQIADLIHEITVERGLDPRDFVLHAFGGSCPLLAGVFGEELNVKRIVVPYTAAVNCAFGLVSADVVHEYAHTTTRPRAHAGGRDQRDLCAHGRARPRAARRRRILRRRRFARMVRRSSLPPAGARGHHAGPRVDSARRGRAGDPGERLRGALRTQIRQGFGLSRRRDRDDDVPALRARPDDPPRDSRRAADRRGPGRGPSRQARRLRRRRGRARARGHLRLRGSRSRQ